MDFNVSEDTRCRDENKTTASDNNNNNYCKGSGCALQTQIPIQFICLVSGFKYVVLGIKYSLVRRSLVGGRGVSNG